MKPTIYSPIRLELTAEDLALIEAGLRLLLMTEDDRDTIERVKALLGQIQRERTNLGR
jgi:hypothetical protein